MKTKFTFLALAVALEITVEAATPATWSVVGTGNGSEKGEVVWGDFNNDGYLDVFQVSNNVFSLYKNNGNETFTDVKASVFPASIPSGVSQAMAMFLDYNNDGNLDLLVAGNSNGNTQSTLYKNSGAPDYSYIVDESNVLVGARTGDDGHSHRVLSTVDYNNDGWGDLFMEGWSDPLGTRVVALYKNEKGTFVRQTTPVGGTSDFEGMNGGSLHTGDVNNDGYADLITCGYSVSGNYATNLYINQGDGTFVKSTASFVGIEQGEAFLFDSNNDGWLDVYVAGVGYSGGWVWPGNLYINNHDGTFTLKTDSGLPSGTQGYTAFESGDINNDGTTDLLVMVPTGGNSAMFYNNGDGTFMKDIPEIAGRARAGSLQLADFNNDNKLDYFVFGWRDSYTFPDNTTFDSNWVAAFVKNTTEVSNSAPNVPGNVVATKTDGKYVISWDKSTDDITPQNALRYNVYVQDELGKVFCYSPADIVTGRLKTGAPVLLSKTGVSLQLPDGNYTIGVQAIDQANVASAFASTTLSIIDATPKTSLGKLNVVASNCQIVIENGYETKAVYSIHSLSGQTFGAGTVNSSSKVIVGGLHNGIYLVTVDCQGKKINRKVVVF